VDKGVAYGDVVIPGGKTVSLPKLRLGDLNTLYYYYDGVAHKSWEQGGFPKISNGSSRVRTEENGILRDTYVDNVSFNFVNLERTSVVTR